MQSLILLKWLIISLWPLSLCFLISSPYNIFHQNYQLCIVWVKIPFYRFITFPGIITNGAIFHSESFSILLINYVVALTPPVPHTNPPFPTSLPTFVSSCVFNNGHSKRCVVISHCGFNLHFPEESLYYVKSTKYVTPKPDFWNFTTFFPSTRSHNYVQYSQSLFVFSTFPLHLRKILE